MQLYSEKALNLVVSHIGGVKAEVAEQAAKTAGLAEARLAGHHKSGRAEVTVTHGEVDSFVNLDDPAALSIEFGHMVKGKFENPDKPKYVPGLYIITGAAGLA